MLKHEEQKPTKTGIGLLGLVLVFACWIHLPSLGHPYLPGWDEAVHAAVAANLTRHPLEPSLVDDPLVPLNFRNWQDSQVWLHMPPMPFWQSAVSIRLGGRSFFWMRLPAFLLFLGTILCIYWLGLKVYDQNAGLLGAIIYASAPFGWLQVQGYHFGDMTDVSLAFWLTLCVVSIERALSTSKKGWMVLAGLSQATALMSKSALALAPVGAVLVIWLAPKIKMPLRPKPKWHLALVLLGLGLSGPVAWISYASHRWPAQWAYETKVQWLHVTTSYEGHGRPWDALFNDLLANLYTPPFALLMIVAALYILHLAFKHKNSAILLHSLWIVGTWLPLVLVKTKVPAVLFGIAPALALAAGVLFIRISRARPGALFYSLAMTPVVFVYLWDKIPHDWFGFAAKLTPDMAATPYLPTQLVLAAGIFLSALALGSVLKFFKWKPSAVFGRIICSFFIVAAMASILEKQRITRRAFEIIADYNPVVSAISKLEPSLPEKATILIEGVTNGRQRPALTASFLTGKPARLVRGNSLAHFWPLARKKGMVYLLTPIQRQADALMEPSTKNGWWVYEGADAPPPPIQSETQGQFARYPQGPDLVRFEPETTTTSPGQQLGILDIWHAKGPASSHMTKIILESLEGKAPLDPWPIPKNFPTGILGIHLHNLSPPGLLWGYRPLGTGMGEPGRWRRGWIVADRFFIWIPRHLKTGRYKLVQQMMSAGQIEKPLDDPSWPIITVVAP